MSEKFYVGIDLGTTNTLVSYVKGDKRKILKFDGSKVLPSVLYVDTKNENRIIIGDDAVGRGKINPDNKVSSSKTFIGSGRKYEFVLNDGSNMTLTPTDVAAEILKEAKNKIIKKFKLEPDDEIYAVITTPAAFSFNQNEETIKAAKLAGINVLGTRPEPIAAAAACMDSINIDKGVANIFVVDIGGGTYDTAVISIDGSYVPKMISAEGDRRLGGDNFDQLIYEYFKFQLEDESGLNLDSIEESGLQASEYYRLKSNLYDCAVEAKEELTNTEKARITRNDMYLYNGEPQRFETVLTRDRFNEICKPLYDKIRKRLDESIIGFKKKGIAASDITHLVLVGGSCYIPAVIELITQKIGLNPIPINDKTTAVAEGAAKLAYEWTTLGESLGGVISQSMGVKVEREEFSKIISKGTHYPCKNTRQYTTTRDNQESIKVQIYAAAPDKENVSRISAHEYYGMFELENIHKGKAGEPKIDVTFEFDESQQLTVTATDCITGSSKKVVVKKDEAQPEKDTGDPCVIDLLIDVSGSMAGRKLSDAKQACVKMVSSIVDLNVNAVGITAFNNEQNNICSIMHDKSALLNSIHKMEAKNTTCMGKGIIFSAAKLENEKQNGKFIIMMTDGMPNSGDRSIEIAKQIRMEKSIRIAVIYIGEENSNGCRYAMRVAEANRISDDETTFFYHSNDMSDLSNIFKSVYADIKLVK